MTESLQVIKKLQFKDDRQPVLILNAPKSYNKIMCGFEGEVHQEGILGSYNFIQVFGTSNSELQKLSLKVITYVKEDGLLWLCYPKKTSKTYKGSDCSRDQVAGLLSAEGYEPVRQIAIDEDWSALRFRKTENIKKMTRKFAVTEKGKERTQGN
ncbi:DUF3052 domain-containing protein [Litchfieldia alkalitelluris]|uniref:DUF3052 domain-containing protein n=1 Tax=Litchfieldia alkalitelluris TaxID=304268 RepID=UPI000995F2C4|nr:DUF3052 domain-containing protein [Litchfieldia alkalitelluris]